MRARISLSGLSFQQQQQASTSAQQAYALANLSAHHHSNDPHTQFRFMYRVHFDQTLTEVMQSRYAS